ncbi:MAG: ATP-binding protein [Cyclobacteriaceae bacterium]
MEVIQRKKYINRITPFINKNLVKVILGQRRVGKSYLLFQLMDFIKQSNPKASVIYINKEQAKFAHINDELDLLKFINSFGQESEKVYLFIDEVQDIRNFEKAVRSLLTDEKYDIYLTGSNATLLSGELSTFLAGRYIEIPLHSLAYQEFLIFHKLENNEYSLHKYIKYGGMPYLIHLELSDELVYEYLINIYNSIILRDIVSRYNIRNVAFLENLTRYLADNLGSLLSASRISNFLKSQQLNYSPKTIIEYLTYLENTFFVQKVRRANVQGRKIFEINDKFYFEDLGLRHSLIRFSIKDINKVMENLVYNHLIYCGYKVFVGQLGKKEIDFMGEKGNKKIYVQVSYQITDEKVHAREFGNLLEINDNHPKYVITMDQLAGESYKGIEHFKLLNFLTMEL